MIKYTFKSNVTHPIGSLGLFGNGKFKDSITKLRNLN